MRSILALLVLALTLVGCDRGIGPTGPGNDPPTPAGTSDWTAPECGSDGDLDRVVAHAGGSLRLCVRQAEVRLWALGADGKPDAGFHKSRVELYFTPTGGEEQMLNGILFKGTPEDGYATRLAGHEGKGVASARVAIDGQELDL